MLFLVNRDEAQLVECQTARLVIERLLALGSIPELAVCHWEGTSFILAHSDKRFANSTTKGTGVLSLYG